MGQFVNQELMTELGVSFSLGADILSKGNRTVEKLLGADKMSGDKVSVTMNGTGQVYENSLDISGRKGKMALQRGSVDVRVSPIGIAAEVSEGELALATKMPEAMDKFTAQLQDRVNEKAYGALLGASQCFVANFSASDSADKIDRAIRQAAFDAEGNTTTSKWAGATHGIVHPQTWNRIVPSMMGNFGANDKMGQGLYKNELGQFLGFDWTKGMSTLRITGAYLPSALSSITIDEKGEICAVNGSAATGISATILGVKGSYDGEVYELPFTLKYNTNPDPEAEVIYEDLKTVDGLGKCTGWKKTFHLKWKVTTWNADYTPASGQWVLANPIFFAGPRKNTQLNAYDAEVASTTLNGDKHGFINPDFEWYAENNWNHINAASGTPSTTWTLVPEGILTPGVDYLAPMVMFKEPDFLVAVKGLEKRPGSESFTIPTKYAEKGIMPWRGTYFNDDYSSLSLFRVDALMGFGTYSGVSMSSVYIPFI